MLDRTFTALELEIERFREILSEVVTCTCLQRLVVLHQRFSCVSTQRTCEALAIGLESSDHRHRHVVIHERAIDAEHLDCLCLGLLLSLVRGMSFLPEE